MRDCNFNSVSTGRTYTATYDPTSFNLLLRPSVKFDISQLLESCTVVDFGNATISGFETLSQLVIAIAPFMV